ncbi:MAG: hypothetical protein M3O15_02505 [Acidobacteriota bacterium]|nr:hypothetical protein [Acidobacteriota bacterium]
MCRTTARLAGLVGLLLLPFGSRIAPAQVLGSSLTYTAVEPCRLFDSRPSQGGPGPLAPGQVRTINVAGARSGDFASQGGHPGGCAIPGWSFFQPQALAVVVNFVAVAPGGPGDLRAWPGDHPMPNASAINFTRGQNLANAIVVPLRRDRQGGDISVMAEGAATHLVVDVVGYFAKPPGVAVVARSGGDYPDPLSALDDLAGWCPQGDVNHPCLLRLMPGVYDLGSNQLALHRDLILAGSGEGITRITAHGSNQQTTPGTVICAENTELRDLTVESTATGAATAIVDPRRLLRVTALATGGTDNTAIATATQGTNQVPLELRQVTAVAKGGRSTRGLALLDQALVEHATVVAEGGDSSNTGISFGGLNLDLSDTDVTVSGGGAGGRNIGISLPGMGSVLTNVTVDATAGGTAVGVFATSQSFAFAGPLTILHSSISGASWSLSIDPNAANAVVGVGASRLAGPVGRSPGLTCAELYDANFAEIGCP